MQAKIQHHFLKLGEVINTIDAFPWDHLLYLQGDQPWESQTPCIVADPSDTDSDDPNEEPEGVKGLELTSSLGVSETQEVVSNAKQQMPDATVKNLVQAFNFYYVHDAFIEF